MKGSEEKCRAAGCSGFLTKPIDIDLLVSSVAEVLVAARVHEQLDAVEKACAQQDLCDKHGQPDLPVPCAMMSAAPCSQQDAPLTSTLPMDDPEFRAIVVGWVGRLQQQLDAMHDAFARHDLAQVVQLAHWLKGSGESMGFSAFTAPAAELEQLAKSRHFEQLDAALAVLTRLADRIVVPEVAPVELPCL
jgi:HPt (histidine-containing phosphotransfer) domain-containing protein